MKPTFGIFGFYRWIMAVMVVIGHLGPNYLWLLAPAAVKGFFVLSGYIVSYILDTRYLHLAHGIPRYCLNRALRVYPAYWAVTIMSAITALALPHLSAQRAITLPPPPDWTTNLLILGGSSYQLVQVAWSLRIEMMWWLLIPLIILKWSETIIALLLIGSCFTATMYFSVWGGALPFILGTLLYHRKRIALPDMPQALGMAFIGLHLVALGICIYARYSPSDLVLWFAFISLLHVPIIYYLSGIDSRRVRPLIKRLDAFLGELAYPIFLVHMLASVFARLFIPGLTTNSWEAFAAGFVIASVLAMIIVCVVENPVCRLRQRIEYA